MKSNSILSLIFLFFSSICFSEDIVPELNVQKHADGVYLHTSYEKYNGWGVVASNGLVILDNTDAYIIDTPTSTKSTITLLNWIKKHGFKAKASISTHFHDDSTGGISYLNSESIPTYASKFTNELIEKKGREKARYTFDGTSYWLLKDQIEIYYPGAGHTKDNVVVWMPKQKILFGGCFVKPESLGNLEDAVLEEWPSSAEKLMSRYGAARIVIPGHGKAGDFTLLAKTRDLAVKGLASKLRNQSDIDSGAGSVPNEHDSKQVLP